MHYKQKTGIENPIWPDYIQEWLRLFLDQPPPFADGKMMYFNPETLIEKSKVGYITETQKTKYDLKIQ